MNELYKRLAEFGKLKIREPLSKYTTYKIGGPADYFITVNSTDNLIGLLKYLQGKGIDYFLLGGGSNVLISDDRFHGVAIKAANQKFEFANEILIADAGCLLANLVLESTKSCLSGLEWASGIPGTVGGAVYGNAGAMGGSMSDIVENVVAYENGEIIEIRQEDCGFKYKDSLFKQNRDIIILRVWLKLHKDERAEIMKKIAGYAQKRKLAHPVECGSAGCAFKNIIVDESLKVKMRDKIKDKQLLETMEKYGKIGVGRLIDLAGLKGLRIGGAQISKRHGNFIINLGNAKASDILSIIDLVKEKVYDRFGIEIEEEIQLINL